MLVLYSHTRASTHVISWNQDPATSIPSARVPPCGACGALSNDMQFVEIRYCSEGLHSCSVPSSVLFHEIAMAVGAHTSISWSEPYMGGSMPHSH